MKDFSASIRLSSGKVNVSSTCSFSSSGFAGGLVLRSGSGVFAGRAELSETVSAKGDALGEACGLAVSAGVLGEACALGVSKGVALCVATGEGVSLGCGDAAGVSAGWADGVAVSFADGVASGEGVSLGLGRGVA